MEKPSIRLLLVDDYEPWRRLFSSMLLKEREIQVVGEASDGLEAVQKAKELRPDLILLDIGLPTLNGIEAAQQIRKFYPAPKILFVSENRSADIVKEALTTGAGGYLLKSDAAGELLPAVNAVLEGKRFVSASLAAADNFNRLPGPQAGPPFLRDDVAAPIAIPFLETVGQHQVAFYSDDRQFLDQVTPFIAAALKAGNAAIAIAARSHRESLLLELQAEDLDIRAAIEEGRYMALDAAELVSTFIVDGVLDSRRFLEAFGVLIQSATKAASRNYPRVAVFGEAGDLLVAQANLQAAIEDENLCNQLIKMYDVDILCGYSLAGIPHPHHSYEQVCALHSVVHSA